MHQWYHKFKIIENLNHFPPVVASINLFRFYYYYRVSFTFGWSNWNKVMNQLSRLLPAFRLCSSAKPRAQYPVNLGLRYQPRLYQPRSYSELPRMKQPGEGKGPITWKTVKYMIGGGAVMFGILKYMEAQRDAGINFNQIIIILR